MKIGVVSLGCSKNLVDTEIMLGFLADSGHEIEPDPNRAEIIIVNTCGFIESAKMESIETILEMGAFKAKGSCSGLIVTGCLSQRYPDQLWREIPEIDGLLGTNELDLINDIVRQVAQGRRVRRSAAGLFGYDQVYKRISTTGRHLAYLKIGEGCSHNCAFCAIPQIRGPFRSRSLPIIVEEGKRLIKKGAREIALIAQDTTAYGRELGINLVQLLRNLAELNVPWLRLLYTYPSGLTRELLEFISREPKFVKYVDLPLQHVSGSVLRRMKRPGDYRSIVEQIQKIRKIIPGAAIRSSFIVGFPGETEKDFLMLKHFLREMRLTHVGIFKYSREGGTSAYKLQPQLEKDCIEERFQELMELQRGISLELNRSFVGEEIDVLIEAVSAESDLVLVGRHQGQAPDVDGVVYLNRGDFNIGDIVPVKITRAYPYDLVGEVLEKDEFT
ncbi:MAG: 30S ribosomal protein S12 methylthiotransferase RimO [Firmicutes bacterium]|nr:30S ribosomal protein S12 methylthiotransferase RimO [Bacillota bacterium]